MQFNINSVIATTNIFLVIYALSNSLIASMSVATD